MPLIAWRKLQAGYGGAEGSADPGLVATHTEQITIEGGSFLSFQEVDKLVVKKVLRIPVGEETYE